MQLIELITWEDSFSEFFLKICPLPPEDFVQPSDMSKANSKSERTN